MDQVVPDLDVVREAVVRTIRLAGVAAEHHAGAGRAQESVARALIVDGKGPCPPVVINIVALHDVAVAAIAAVWSRPKVDAEGFVVMDLVVLDAAILPLDVNPVLVRRVPPVVVDLAPADDAADRELDNPAARVVMDVAVLDDRVGAGLELDAFERIVVMNIHA